MVGLGKNGVLGGSKVGVHRFRFDRGEGCRSSRRGRLHWVCFGRPDRRHWKARCTRSDFGLRPVCLLEAEEKSLHEESNTILGLYHQDNFAGGNRKADAINNGRSMTCKNMPPPFQSPSPIADMFLPLIRL